RLGRHSALLRPAHARGRDDQVEPPENPQPGERAALHQRAEEGAEGVAGALGLFRQPLTISQPEPVIDGGVVCPAGTCQKSAGVCPAYLSPPQPSQASEGERKREDLRTHPPKNDKWATSRGPWPFE